MDAGGGAVEALGPMASADRSSPSAAGPPGPDRGRELVLAVVATHAGSLLSVARRYSLCADDAQDAYQRALEIFLRRADSLDPASAPAWLRTVVKHEALAVRAGRVRLVGPAEVDLDRTEARDLPPADERVLAGERDARSTEALARLKPQEVRALVLKARGYSYNEIAEITGWTYTKVNRCLTEGRRAFLDRFADIEAGRECERWAATLSALADGEASSADIAAARPHLRNCQACRARLREFRLAPRAVATLAPTGMGTESDVPGILARVHDAVLGAWHERVLLSAHKIQAGLEAASAGKLAAVAASATALAGGGAAALTEVAGPTPARPAVAVTRPQPRPEPAPSKGHGQEVDGAPTTSPAPSVSARTPSARGGDRPGAPTVAPSAGEFEVGGGPAAGPTATQRAPAARAGSTDSAPGASPAAARPDSSPRSSAHPGGSPAAVAASSSHPEFAP
jgi:RNA polymerase sigma factor (sigma-70 family)